MIDQQITTIRMRAKVNNLEKVIGSQIITYCYVNDIWLKKSEFDTLLHIAMEGYNKFTTLDTIVQKGIFKSKQCVRNTRNDLVKKGLLVEVSPRQFEITNQIVSPSSETMVFDFKTINVT